MTPKKKPRRAYGTPYTLSEVKLVLERHRMNPYHRDLMSWLLREIQRLRRKPK